MLIIKVVNNNEDIDDLIKKLIDLKNLGESLTIRKHGSKRKGQLHRFNHLIKKVGK